MISERISSKKSCREFGVIILSYKSGLKKCGRYKNLRVERVELSCWVVCVCVWRISHECYEWRCFSMAVEAGARGQVADSLTTAQVGSSGSWWRIRGERRGASGLLTVPCGSTSCRRRRSGSAGMWSSGVSEVVETRPCSGVCVVMGVPLLS